ncbi:MAG: hypothetical protein PUP92_24580 [Rhizonema sp. PD38]|nr:hypothetical protein [Rhizonema sp. PD38]
MLTPIISRVLDSCNDTTTSIGAAVGSGCTFKLELANALPIFANNSNNINGTCFFDTIEHIKSIFASVMRGWVGVEK